MGIRWYIRYKGWYKKPSLIFDFSKYFSEIWPEKLKLFINELNSGDDFPNRIYEKAGCLSPLYSKVHQIDRKPLIFEIFFSSSLNPYNEIKEMIKIVERLNKKLSICYEYNNFLPLCHLLEDTLMDLKALLYNLMNIVDSGHVLGGYMLLRKVITTLSRYIFLHSLIMYLDMSGYISQIEKNLEEATKEDIENLVDNFLSSWWSMDSYGNVLEIINPQNTTEGKNREKIKITNLENFIHFIKNKNDNYLDLIKNNLIKDAFYYQFLDYFIENKDTKNLFEISSFSEFVNSVHNNMASEEYKKLSKAVHEPISVDFPPFSSTIEYIGFIYHLRKVKYIVKEAVASYSKIVRKYKKGKNT